MLNAFIAWASTNLLHKYDKNDWKINLDIFSPSQKDIKKGQRKLASRLTLQNFYLIMKGGNIVIFYSVCHSL